MSDYMHSIPGRLRVKRGKIKNNPVEATKIKQLLKPLDGLQNVDINLVTGSVLIRYNPAAITAEAILQRLEEGGYYEPGKAVTHDELLHSALSRAGKAVGSLALGAIEFDSPTLTVIAALI